MCQAWNLNRALSVQVYFTLSKAFEWICCIGAAILLWMTATNSSMEGLPPTMHGLRVQAIVMILKKRLHEHPFAILNAGLRPVSNFAFPPHSGQALKLQAVAEASASAWALPFQKSSTQLLQAAQAWYHIAQKGWIAARVLACKGRQGLPLHPKSQKHIPLKKLFEIAWDKDKHFVFLGGGTPPTFMTERIFILDRRLRGRIR